MKKILLLIIIACLLGGGWYWWSHIYKGDADWLSHLYKANDNGEIPPTSAPAQSVAVIEVNPKIITYTQELPGRISPFRQSQVRPQVNGIITERLFVEGSDVEKGQQLYQIDEARYIAALNSAKADLSSAQAKVKTVKARAERYKDLVKIKAISTQEYDDALAQLDQARADIAVAKAAVDLAQVNLDYTKVYAPIAGRISRSFVTEGALVTSNQAQHLATITQLDPAYVDMQQSSAEAIHLRSRMKGAQSVPIDLILDNQSNQATQHEGILKFSEVTVGETTGSVALRALVSNPDALLLPGLFVKARLNLGRDEAVLVPQRATTRSPNGTLTVWVVDEKSQANQLTIEVAQAYEDQWVVSKGLKAGDTVIVQGYQKVGPGTQVTPSPWKKVGGSQDSTASGNEE